MIEAPDIVFEDGRKMCFSSESGSRLTGEPLSFGRIKGRARIVKDFRSSSALKPGDILVTHHTDPGWTPLFSVCGGVIVEAGGLICHAAMVARELGVPAVVLRNATSIIPDGARIELDADSGTIKIVGTKK
jgi:pyruvate,water dikinase